MNLLLHVVPIAALLQVFDTHLDFDHRAHDRHAVGVPDTAAVQSQFGNIAFFEKNEAIGHRPQRQHVRGNEVLANPHADNKRAPLPCRHDLVWFVVTDHTDRIGTIKHLERCLHGG